MLYYRLKRKIQKFLGLSYDYNELLIKDDDMIYKIHFNNFDINDKQTLVIKTYNWKLDIGEIFSYKGNKWEVDEISCGENTADIFCKMADYNKVAAFILDAQ